MTNTATPDNSETAATPPRHRPNGLNGSAGLCDGRHERLLHQANTSKLDAAGYQW
jgi:hypothetical protein